MKALTSIYILVVCNYISVCTMEAPPGARPDQQTALSDVKPIIYSRLESLSSDIKIHIIKDIIGQSVSKQQAIKALRTFLAADRKLQNEFDPRFLYRMENLLGWAWYHFNPYSFIPDLIKSKIFEQLNTVSKTFDRSGISPDLLLEKSCTQFHKLWAKMQSQAPVTYSDVEDMELNYQYPTSINPANPQQLERFTPLCAALHLNNGQAVEEILNAEANVEKTTRVAYKSPLYIACNKGNVAAVRSLLAHGAQVNTRLTAFHQNALHIVAQNKEPIGSYHAIYWMLLDAGIDKTPVDVHGHTAQYYYYNKSD